MKTDSIITAKNLSFRFSTQTLFSNFCFDLKSNESVSILGANGAGKTTLLRILAGLLKPTTGTLSCCGETIWPRRSIRHEHKSMYLAYTPSFYLQQSVGDNFDFYLKCYGSNIDPFTKRHVFEFLNLDKLYNETVCNLSTGQKRRLTLAAMLALKPHVVFADEPTNGLDAEGIRLCLQIFDQLMQQENTSFVVATHDDVLKQWCQKSISLHDFKCEQIAQFAHQANISSASHKIRTLL